MVAGFRWHKDGEGVGSLLLGLYDGEGDAAPRGRVRVFSAKQRRELRRRAGAAAQATRSADHPWREWADAEAHATAAGRMPGARRRWNAKKDLSWEPLRPELVCEVTFDQLTNGRFRHNAQFVRWRPDRDPRRAPTTSSRWSPRSSWLLCWPGAPGDLIDGAPLADT